MIYQRTLFRKIEPYLSSPEALIITGMRRTGKTSLLRYIQGTLADKNVLFLDLENPLNRKYFEQENYDRIKANLAALGLDFSRKAVLLLDEIQHQRNLPSVAKFLIDHAGVKFIMTGSAGFYIRNLFSETLAGRKYLFELHPLTFGEFLRFKESRLAIPSDPKEVTEAMADAVLPLYEEYLAFGGFPGVVLKPSVQEKRLALDEIFTSYYNQEVVQFGDFRRNTAVRDLILLLAARTGARLDIQKISREMGLARQTVYDYLAFLEGTFLVSLVRPFTGSRDAEIRKAPKVYLCDSGLAGHLARLDEGAVFETSVFQNLRVEGGVHYYQKKSGPEIDFVSNGRTGYEVKATPQPSDVKRLRALSAGLKLDGCRIVSKRFSPLDGIIPGFMLGQDF
jgi:uncharacterized protein